MRKSIYLLPVLLVVFVIAISSVFIVDEREKALVLQFGQIVKVKEDPGLGFKIPFIQNVVSYDDRILSRDLDPLEVTPSDDRRLVVDAFARYRIVDVRQFRQAVGAGGEEVAARRLDGILRDTTRNVLGTVASNDILSTDRAALMLRIRNNAIAEARGLGLEVIDVRLKRTDLPPENLNATYERMIAERDREAADEVARGNEAAQRTRAAADRTVVELTSDAQRQADITRGEADAERNAIFADAFGADPEFFAFYRSMTAYERFAQQGRSSMVLSPDSEFFNYLQSDQGQTANQTAAAAPAAPAEGTAQTPATSEPEASAGEATPAAPAAEAQPAPASAPAATSPDTTPETGAETEAAADPAPADAGAAAPVN
ncbi:protease FtsH subunit HflC [Loktanella atrilutea]|uniref:Protease FtsH subunit HflC n=1 Tax=Loktanella atrilutea TaxID=366533 RepID=A0A1M5A5R8_LOKAT|nr:protease modulator HflC [Loktanella atrilutea]SHF25643.1 protease FtsH subunit HflC [Loktanella atrilutea]